MNPNIPHCKPKSLLIDKNTPIQSKKMLLEMGYKIIETKHNHRINDSTATHPDMQFVLIDTYKAYVCDNMYEYYKHELPNFELKSVSDIFSPYPNDCKLNFSIIGNYCFAAIHQKSLIPIKYKIIPVKQGYIKCNISILNENAFITSDKGIINEALKYGFRAYYLPSDEISLKGYKNGFWGGCSGLIGKNIMFFNGNIERLTCYSELINILNKEKIEPIYPSDVSLCDIGSIIPLF